MKLSSGNLKMKRGFLIWNIPAISTCPGSTPLCRQHCYARKAEKQYPDCLPSRQANLDSFNRDEMVKMISNTVKRSKTFKGFFRIHESGDFYDQAYLDDWISIAREFPEIKFLAFTKSFHLDFSKRTKNLQIISSIMPDTTAAAVKKTRKAYAGKCPDMPENVIQCPGTCDNCGLCWSLSDIKRDVHFNMH